MTRCSYCGEEVASQDVLDIHVGRFHPQHADPEAFRAALKRYYAGP